MTGTLFRRLILIAVVLLGTTLLAINYVLTRPAGVLSNAAERQWILGISAASAIAALGIAYIISRSLSLRVRRLKQLAEGLPGGGGAGGPIDDAGD